MEPITTDTDPPKTPSKGQTCSQTRCSICWDLRPDMTRTDFYPVSKLQLAYEDLISSRQKGCITCSLILRASEMLNPQPPPTRILVTVRAKDKSLQELYPLEIQFEGGGMRGIKLQLFEEHGFPVGLPIGQARGVSQHPSSSKCMNLLSSWLSQCRDNHEACSDPPDVTLPTRVISVGSETTLPRLYVPEKGTRGQYAALSHCWGGDIPLKTLTANIEEHQHGIPEDRLPKTFLDAVHIARTLQIPFLWIDGLCIIQDDHEDWARESGRMGSYYSGTTLTIAADCAANSSEGCFKERTQGAWDFARIERSRFGLKNDVYLRVTPEKYRHGVGHCFWPASPSDFDNRNPLNTRAWTLQETFLSKRIVHFTHGEMVWDCQKVTACECSVGETKEAFPTLNKPPFKDLPALYKEWMQIVHVFSKRSITHETDRLPAISGVAEVFSQVTKDEYVCGIWKNYPSTLLWEPESAGSSLRQDKFYAPSWSWASIATPIREDPLYFAMKLPEYCCLAEILNIDSTPATANPFGPVKKHAKLTIQGYVYPGRFGGDITLPLGNGYRFLIEKHCSDGRIDFDYLPRPEDKAGRKPDIHPGDDFIILLIRLRSGRTDFFGKGLVLKAVDESASVYQRIGVYRAFYDKPAAPGWYGREKRIVTLV